MVAATVAGDASVVRAEHIVQAVDLSKWFDRRCVLDKVNLDIAPGAFLALLGANGAGKSTLLRLLATLIPPSAGELHLFDRAAGRNGAVLRARIGMIGHQPILYRDLTILENLRFFGRLYCVKNVDDRAMALLERVSLAHRANDTVSTLSRGMTQRVSVVRALMHDPPLILADEPFAGLDAPSADNLEHLLRQLNADGRTIVVSNHDIAQSLRLAKHAVVLRAGQVVIDRPAANLTSQAVLKEVAA